MKRLVYSPFVQAYVKSDDGVVDISQYLVSGSINRKVNQVSSAQLTLRNPVHGDSNLMLFTEHQAAQEPPHSLFHPMDPIIIVMQRLANQPVQVFTGYLDTAPYIQLYPGLCSLSASCTLKRLLYTQWDASLPAVTNFLEQYGWQPNGSGIWNPNAESATVKGAAGQVVGQFNDGSIGALLFAVMNFIGDWDEKTIWIEALPPQIKEIVVALWANIEPEVQQGETLFESLISQVLGDTSHGSGSGTPTTGASGANVTNNGISGTRWLVSASAESLGGNGACRAIQSQGYSELSTTPSPGNVSLDDFAALGHIPCLTPMLISNPSNGKTVTVLKQDVGSGSDFLPVMGIYPGTLADLGFPPQSNNHVEIQRADGKPLSPVRGKLISGTPVKVKTKHGNSSAGHQGNAQTASANTSTAPLMTTAIASGLANASKVGRSPGNKKGNASTSTTNAPAVYGKPFASMSGVTLSRTDQGVDYAPANGTAILAIGNCHVNFWAPGAFDGNYFCYELEDGDKAGMSIYVNEAVTPVSTVIGTKFRQGMPIAHIDTSIGSGSLEMGWFDASANTPLHKTNAISGATYAENGPTLGGWMFTNFLNSIGQVTRDHPPAGTNYGGGSAAGGAAAAAGGGGASATSSGGGNSMAAAFSTMINLPSIYTAAEAELFTGKRSFIADQPLFPFVEQICKASMRNFMSMPNGNFFAFFPDYFGFFGRKYYWSIRDIEIIDGRIDLSDDSLLTHMAVAGDVTTYSGEVTFQDLVLTAGIFDIFDAFSTGYVGNLKDPEAPITTKVDPTVGRDAALAFLQKYGARPYVEEVPAIRSPFYELFLAFQNFLIAWSKQFETTFEFTFMPELFPGGIIALPDHHIQCYVEEVVHNFDYEQGFTTTANLSSPSQIPSDSASRPNITQGNARPLTALQAAIQEQNIAKIRNQTRATNTPQHQVQGTSNKATSS